MAQNKNLPHRRERKKPVGRPRKDKEHEERLLLYLVRESLKIKNKNKKIQPRRHGETRRNTEVKQADELLSPECSGLS